jgi:UDP-N-acetylglucosamine 3-dehydrogenase
VLSAPLRLAFLGCGEAARLHASALRGLDPAVERRYASRDAQRARDFATALGGSGSFPSYAAAIASPETDVVVVLTPPPQHLEWTLAALRAGKHVVVEKPPFLRSSDFDAVEAAVRESGRRALVAENYHYKPLVRTLNRLLTRGAIGPVRFVAVNAMKQQRARGWRAESAQTGGGALYEGGVHWVNLMTSLGLSVRGARGLLPTPAATPERSVLALFEYSEGAVGALLHSWEAPSPLRGLRLSRVYGRDGSIAFESNGLFVFVWGRTKRLCLPGLLRDLTGRKAMWRDFLGCFRTGREPLLSLAHVRRDLELVEAVYDSVGLASRRNDR